MIIADSSAWIDFFRGIECSHVNQLENAITSNNNGFVVDGPTTDFSSETTTVKFWASTDPTGVLDNETPVAGVYQMGSANDLVYLRNIVDQNEIQEKLLPVVRQKEQLA